MGAKSSSSPPAACLRAMKSTINACSSKCTPLSFSLLRAALKSILCRRYLQHTLDQYVENDYTLVYFHFGLNSKTKPSFKWLRQAYSDFDRKSVVVVVDAFSF
jgi:hypothetical protein